MTTEQAIQVAQTCADGLQAASGQKDRVAAWRQQRDHRIEQEAIRVLLTGTRYAAGIDDPAYAGGVLRVLGAVERNTPPYYGLLLSSYQ